MIGAGLAEPIAEALADEQAKLINAQLATNSDVEQAKNELTIRTGAMIVALGGFLAAIKFLGH